MTRRRDLEQQLHMLGEIRDIMNSMKTLAYMETRKLSRFLENQYRIIDNIEAIAADFVSNFQETILYKETAKPDSTDVYLLIGSERGFCGDFNEILLPVMESCISDKQEHPVLITIGHKLHNILEQDSRIFASIDGASVVEEIPPVLANIADTLIKLQVTQPALSLYVIYHAEEHGGLQSDGEHQVLMRKLLPPFQAYLDKEPPFTTCPVLNVPPGEFLLELTDQYLLAGLHEILYTSLMAENQRRMQHLEGAVQHMDERAEELTGLCNSLRQEEIIEEIEVILLNTTGPESHQPNRKQ